MRAPSNIEPFGPSFDERDRIDAKGFSAKQPNNLYLSISSVALGTCQLSQSDCAHFPKEKGQHPKQCQYDNPHLDIRHHIGRSIKVTMEAKLALLVAAFLNATHTKDSKRPLDSKPQIPSSICELQSILPR